MILDIRGTNGSGKSWVVSQLLEVGFNYPILENGKQIGSIVPSLDLCVVGKYTETGGGCDGLRGGVVEVERLVRLLHRRHGNMVLEGIMVSQLFGRFERLARELHDYRFLFLDTPLEVCIERVKARRLTKGNTKPFDPEKNLVRDFNRTRFIVKGKLERAGHTVKMLDWRNPFDAVLKELKC